MAEGNNVLNQIEHRLIALQLYVMHKFHVFTYFKYTRVNIPQKTRAQIWFFIPVSAEKYKLVEAFLKDELEAFQEPDRGNINAELSDEDWFFPGTETAIFPIEGPFPYTPREYSEAFTRESLKNFKRLLRDTFNIKIKGEDNEPSDT